jgi:2-amino-4-hydroxy-6-hydroxymethyldihydropteridine diphosphokinase
VKTAYLAFGSNLGDRLANLRGGVAALESGGEIEVRRLSSVYETAPIGLVEQPAFLNLAAEIATTFSASELLSRCLEIEARAGRIRRERWGPRILDLDILWYDDVRQASETLSLPHPRMMERAFVLIPLAEIAPRLVIEGETVAARAAALEVAGVARFGHLDGTGGDEVRGHLA